MKKKIVAIFMATILSVSLVACSTGNSTADTKQETETTVSAKDTKDDTKKEDSKKKESDKEKSESKKTESEKKDSEKEKSESEKKEEEAKKESAKKDEKTDTKKETAKADTANKDNSTQKPNNSANNNNKPSTPSQPNNQPSTPTPQPTPEPTPTPTPQPEPTPTPTPQPEPTPEPEPEPPAHQHSYQVVSSTNGDCSHAGTVTKQCSCGATVTETGSYGNHNWSPKYKDTWHEPVTKEEPIYEGQAICNQCGQNFGNGPSGTKAAAKHVASTSCVNYSVKTVQVGTKTVIVKEGYTSHDFTHNECTICHKHDR